MIRANSHLVSELIAAPVDSDNELEDRLAQLNVLLDDAGPAVLVLEDTTLSLTFHNTPAKALFA